MTSPIEKQTGAAPGRRLSVLLSGFCLVLIIASPVLSFLILALNPEAATDGLGLPAPSEGPAFTFGQRVVILVVGLAPIIFVTYALVCARRCFRSFTRGEYFSSWVVRNLRGLAAGIAFWALAGWLVAPLMSVLLTLGAEEHRFVVNFSQGGLLTLLFAGIVWQIADIMTRAAALAEENAQFI